MQIKDFNKNKVKNNICVNVFCYQNALVLTIYGSEQPYLNSVANTVINHRIRLESTFQEILYMIDAWFKNGSYWNNKLIGSQYINISTYRPLSGSFYINLPVELRSPKKKGVINIKKKDQNCF